MPALTTVTTHNGFDTNGTWSPDGSNPQEVTNASGADDDVIWGDIAWSRDDWILFIAVQKVNSCFEVRTDKIRPDGSFTHR
jgi:hypothetical protein